MLRQQSTKELDTVTSMHLINPKVQRQSTNVKVKDRDRLDHREAFKRRLVSMAINDMKSFKYDQFFLESNSEDDNDDGCSQKGSRMNKVIKEDRIDEKFLWFGKRFGEHRIE